MGTPHPHKPALLIPLALLAAAAVSQENVVPMGGRMALSDMRTLQPWIEIPAAARRDFDLGHAVFNTQWLPTGSGASGNQGLGPQFIETSCNGCHVDGARGRPPAPPQELSNSFVMQLGGRATAYGHVINTRAVAGHVPEGRITVTVGQRTGQYPDGERWTLRVPQYAVESLSLGQLPANAVLKPRIGPALFGAGLLDAVSQPAVDSIRQAQPRSVRGSAGGRFGWQGGAIALVDQTAIAFAREMGLTSEIEPLDDCTPAQATCSATVRSASPELPERLFHAVNTFQFLLAAPARASIDPAKDVAGARLFESTGCAACHVTELSVPRENGSMRIDPFTDLLLHDLGDRLADRTVSGRPVRSLWRTAPLWGLAFALKSGPIALLHDGRAASIEEAILWHEGQAEQARRRFMKLDAASRRQLLEWIATL
jgi:CxxC motif-containing protein (DUF1111 family)